MDKTRNCQGFLDRWIFKRMAETAMMMMMMMMMMMTTTIMTRMIVMIVMTIESRFSLKPGLEPKTLRSIKAYFGSTFSVPKHQVIFVSMKPFLSSTGKSANSSPGLDLAQKTPYRCNLIPRRKHQPLLMTMRR